jgi:tetratricopeptide (TPR) repeat protein
MPAEVVHELAGLVDKSLVQQQEQPDGTARFTMLETVREYARERLEASGEADLVRQQHLAYFVGLAERAAPEIRGPRQREWLDILELEHSNLRAALDWSTQQGEVVLGLRLAGALWRFWHVRGHLSEGRARLAHLLDLSERLSDIPGAVAARAEALYGAGVLARFQSDFASARALHEEALACWRTLGDLSGIGYALLTLGYYTMLMVDPAGETGDLDSAQRLLEEGLEAQRNARDRLGVAWLASHLGCVRAALGDRRDGRRLVEEGLATFRAAGEQIGASWALRYLAQIACDEGDHKSATSLLRESLAVSHGLGDRRHVAQLLDAFGEVAAAQMQPEHALCLTGAADSLRQAIGSALAPFDRARVYRWLEPAKQVLGETAETAWREGRSMSFEQAVAYALEQPDTPV